MWFACHNLGCFHHAVLVLQTVPWSHCWPKEQGMFSGTNDSRWECDERVVVLQVTCGINCCRIKYSESWEVRNEWETQWYWKTASFCWYPGVRSACLLSWHCLKHSIVETSILGLQNDLFPSPWESCSLANLVFIQILPITIIVVSSKEKIYWTIDLPKIHPISLQTNTNTSLHHHLHHHEVTFVWLPRSSPRYCRSFKLSKPCMLFKNKVHCLPFSPASERL